MRTVIILFLVSLMMALAAVVAYGDDDPHKNMDTHWYDPECCNLKDCRPVKPEDVWVKDGKWYWKSWRNPKQHMYLPVDSKKVRPSKDGRFHGCERKYPTRDGVNRAICFYLPALG